MNNTPPPCRAIEVVTFAGDHSKHFTATFRSALRAEKNGLGPGPSALDCLLYLGHTGISMDGGTTV
jgi:hypothetical protein